MYAIWFLFEQNDHDYLYKFISQFSLQYNSPIFVPHITVYGLFDADIETIENIISESIKNIQSFSVEKNSISFSNDFWKTIFIDFKLNSNMSNVNKKLNKYLSKLSDYDFHPHTSLIYKIMSLEEKQRLSNSINIKNTFRIDKIAILKFSKCIDEWEIIKKFSLDQN